MRGWFFPTYNASLLPLLQLGSMSIMYLFQDIVLGTPQDMGNVGAAREVTLIIQNETSRDEKRKNEQARTKNGRKQLQGTSKLTMVSRALLLQQDHKNRTPWRYAPSFGTHWWWLPDGAIVCKKQKQLTLTIWDIDKDMKATGSHENSKQHNMKQQNTSVLETPNDTHVVPS